jgi:hypothetical protein
VTGDDEAKLKDECNPKGDEQESTYGPQPPQNVLIEIGKALAMNHDQTIVIQVGEVKRAPISRGSTTSNLTTQQQRDGALRNGFKLPAAD